MYAHNRNMEKKLTLKNADKKREKNLLHVQSVHSILHNDKKKIPKLVFTCKSFITWLFQAKLMETWMRRKAR